MQQFPLYPTVQAHSGTIHFFEERLEGVLKPQAPDNAGASELVELVPKPSAQQDGSTSNTKSHAFVISIAKDIIQRNFWKWCQ
jgi:hypothetical protein